VQFPPPPYPTPSCLARGEVNLGLRSRLPPRSHSYLFVPKRMVALFFQIASEMPSRSVSPTSFRKPCTLCSKPQPVLVRCQIDSSGTWHLFCPGKCWKSVSGGVVDAAGHRDEFPHYRYGGMWKNKYEMVSAKKPKKKAKATRDTEITAPRSNLPGGKAQPDQNFDSFPVENTPR
jgi:hypothetical protein